MDKNKQLGLEIREARKKKGYTQEQLADEIHVVKATVSAWELGKNPISENELKKINEILGTDFSYIQRINEKGKKKSMTIKVTLNAGNTMNYHSHRNRDEVWVVLAGEGMTIVDGMEQSVSPGDVITMSAGCRHTVIAKTELKLIEVQLGRSISVHDKIKYKLEY